MISIRSSELRPQYDVIVIGAGVGGLICAGFLRRAGLDVLLLDHHYLPGGYCTAFPRKGYTIDAAVHHIGACGRFGTVGQILKQFGLKLPFVQLNPMDRVHYPDLEFTIASDIEEYQKSLQDRFPHEQEALQILFKDLIRLYRQILRHKGELYEKYFDATFASFLQDYVQDPQLRRILSGQWGYLGLPAEQISALGMVQMLVSYLRDGAWYPIGSTQHFSNALAQDLLDQGAHVLLKRKVEEVLVSKNRVSGVRLQDGRTVTATTVVSNIDARLLFDELLPDQVCQQERESMSTLIPGQSYFGLYLGLDASLDLSRLPRGFYYPAAHECEGAVEWIYLSITTRYDPALAPKGKHIFSSTVGVRADTRAYQNWQADKEAMARAVLNYLEPRVPRIQDHIELMDAASPRTLARYTLARNGVAYGWAVRPEQAGDRRFPAETSLNGLYLVGQWTSPGPGVAAVAASGWSVANRVLARENCAAQS